MADRYFDGFVFFVLPFIVDVVLLTVGGVLAGKRLLALIVALVYLSANIALPTFLLMGREDGVPWAFFVWLVVLRVIEFGPMRFGYAWRIMWRGPDGVPLSPLTG